jgi:hypothetical protein
MTQSMKRAMETAPEWAKWIAMDADHRWAWHSVFPRTKNGIWERKGEKKDFIPFYIESDADAGLLWKHTLTEITIQRVPEPVVVEPAAAESVEDVLLEGADEPISEAPVRRKRRTKAEIEAEEGRK